jgi:hypothetical protein
MSQEHDGADAFLSCGGHYDAASAALVCRLAQVYRKTELAASVALLIVLAA